MKHLYIFFTIVLVSLFAAEPLLAQQEVMIRELNTYDAPLQSQDDLPSHPLMNTEVTFDAIVVSYPRNSGNATPNKGDSGAEPGRIHVFVTDVNAIDEGEDGMSMQFVVEGAQMRTLEGLDRGDVIRVTGSLGSFFNTLQFNANDVEWLGNIYLGSQYADLEPLLEPEVISLSEINQPSANGETHRWVPEGYEKYAHRYIKFEGLEVIGSLESENGRPWMLLSDGNTVVFTADYSLRYRNGRGTYGFKVEDDGGQQDTVLSLGYNYRRMQDSLSAGYEGPFTPPLPGTVVDISGYYIVNPSFDPVGFDESNPQSVIRIIPWEDGVRWTADGNDLENRVTEGIPNDLEVLGFAPTLDSFTMTPNDSVTSTDEVALSIDVIKPDESYILESVQVAYTADAYTEDGGDTTTVDMTASGNTYSFTFPSYDTFTRVSYTITATAETSEGVQTQARQSGSFYVISETQTAPVTFSRPAGNYDNSVQIALSTVTADADIYYTLDGTDPDENSEVYSSTIVLNQADTATTIKAYAVSEGLDDSPINERTYSVGLSAIQVNTIAELRAAEQGVAVQFLGEAVVTYTQSFRNQKYIMDDTGGILIDDDDVIIASEYVEGDIITNVLGELTTFGGTLQFVPETDPGSPAGTADVVPQVVTLAELDPNTHQSMLVKINDVNFEATGTFATGEDYAITDPSLEDGETSNFRTNFFDADYIGTDVPEGSVNITGIVSQFQGDPQITARSSADIEITTSNEPNELPLVFALDQNYPNPFNPTTVIRYSVANAANVQLQVYDILGRKVATLVNEMQTPGVYAVNFDARSLSSGTYFYRIEAGDFTSIKKMMLIK
ncbi:MAG: chitobiase/beta-hexosaminidase C-terminal domain-containing protein [Gracilimonas sp.]